MAIGSEARSTFLAVVKGDASQAVTEFKKLGSTVEKSTKGAEGSVGKFKQATSGAFAEIKANAGMMAAGAGAAVAAFAFKAVSDFSELGVAVGKFADATGLSTEESSRWIEVAGDLGIESGALQGALGKLSKAIDPAKFREYGIEIAKTASGATDINATFLNVIDRLNAIKDPAERAKIATKLLGRGWQELSELIGKGSSQLRQSLAGVSQAKVMDPAEVERARKFRDAMDNLKDVVEDFTINVGAKLIPALTRVVDILAKLPIATRDFAEDEKRLGIVIGGTEESLTRTDVAMRTYIDLLKWSGLNAQQARPYIEEYIKVNGIAVTELESYTDATKVAAGERMYEKRLMREAQASQDAAEATHELRKALKDLNDIQLDSLDQKADAITAYNELIIAQRKYNDDLSAGKTPTEELAIRANELANKQADLAKQQGEVNGHQQTAAERTAILMSKYNELQSTLEPGSPLWLAIQAYKDALLSVPSTVSTSFQIRTPGGGVITVRDSSNGKQGSNSGVVGTAATGTASAKRGTYLVGENGPELVQMRGGERVFPTPQTRSMLGGNVYNVTIAPRVMPTERELVDILNGLTRRQGSVVP